MLMLQSPCHWVSGPGHMDLSTAASVCVDLDVVEFTLCPYSVAGSGDTARRRPALSPRSGREGAQRLLGS